MDHGYPDYERRKMPRVTAGRELQVAVISPHVDMTLRELGLGGFSAESPKALPIDSAQIVEFTAMDGSHEHLTAIVQRCDQRRGPGYVVGFTFADQSRPAVITVVNWLMDRMAAILSFS